MPIRGYKKLVSEALQQERLYHHKHTTTGITVNNLECLKDDILQRLGMLFPEDDAYYHARFLQSYGAMAGNPTGHLKAMVTGNHAVFPIVDGAIMLGKAQEIYLAEFDGPQIRDVMVTIQGE
ncbi:MAG: secondary thiamine-phosphate synthase enzyme YjbQ [Clostridium sp.]